MGKSSAKRPREDAPRDRRFDGWRVPATAKARALVAEAIIRIENYELHFKLRKRKRKARDQASFEATVGAIVCDLIHHQLSQAVGRISVPRDRRKLARRSRYRPAALGKALPRVLDTMATPEMSMVEMTLGGRTFELDELTGEIAMRGKQTTIGAGVWLRRRIKSMELAFVDLGRDDNEEVVILKEAKRPGAGGVLRADPKEYTDDRHTIRLRDDMRVINSWYAKVDIGLAGDFPNIDVSDRRLCRVFNNARFDHGGRFSGGWWTNLPKAIKREHLRINGERVVLLDFNCLYPRLAYARVGVQPTVGDLYTAVPGLETHRKGAQMLFNAMLFDGKERVRKPKGTREKLPGVPVGDLISAIEKIHAPIAKLFGRGIGFELMHMESQIMVEVLLRLRGLGIVGLPVYDCLIVAQSNCEEAIRVMTSVGKQAAGCILPVTVDE